MLEIRPELICEPEREAWKRLAAENRGRGAPPALVSPDERDALREEIYREAAAYTEDLARRAPGLEVLGRRSARPGSDIIAAGHQPIIDHCGIAMKTILLQREIGEGRARGLNVIVDVDNGDGGLFIFPKPAAAERGAVIGSARIAAGGGLFVGQALTDSRQMERAFLEAAEALAALGLQDAAARTREAGLWYAQLSGWAAADANAAVRRHWESAPAYLDVPLSRLLRLRSVAAFFSRMLADFEALAAAYNRVLDDYRREKGIDNAANPFPNLRCDGERCELPFWLIDLRRGLRAPLAAVRSGSRVRWEAESRVLLELSGDARMSYIDLLPADCLIAPRALPLSLFLRFAVSDLFVHGTGGARYDACTDRFIAEYYRCTPPRHAVVSGSRYLFKQRLETYLRSRKLLEKRRDICFHPEKYLEEELFSGGLRERVAPLIAEKARRVRELKEAKRKGESAAAPTRAAKALEAEVRRLVDQALESRIDPLAAKDPADLAPYFNREYPFFMFSRDEM